MTLISDNFDQAASTYNQVGHIQRAAARHLVNLIPKDLTLNKILDVGAGTGYVTQFLSKNHPKADFTINDVSSRMLDEAAKQLCSLPTLCRHLGDAEHDQFPMAPYDLIASNMAIQWFENWRAGILNLLGQTGILAFSTLTSQTFFEWQHVFNQHDLPSSLRKHPSLEDLTNFVENLTDSPLILDHQFFEITFDKPEDFITYLKALGAQAPHSTESKNALKQVWASIPRPLTVSYSVFFAIVKPLKLASVTLG